MKRRTNTESGFTLLELLISLAAVAALVAFSLMAVRLATASREAGTQKADIHQRLRVLHERLNSTLRSTNLIFVSADSESLLPDENEEKSGDSKVLAFEGKPESLRFVTYNQKLMETKNSHWMHEVHFHLHKNEETGSLEILLNERDFSPRNFFKKDAPESETGQTLQIAQDVAYLKFRYYYEISEEGNKVNPPDEDSIKISGKWTDKLTTELIDFKGGIGDNKNTDNNEDSIRLPRAVEVSVGLRVPDHSEKDGELQVIELQPFIVHIQSGKVFERFKKEEEENDNVSKE